jgi:hypothetical protein
VAARCRGCPCVSVPSAASASRRLTRLPFEQTAHAFTLHPGATGALARNTALVEHHTFDSGHDGVPYVNFTFATRRPRELWLTVQELLYREGDVAAHMRQASMAFCSSEEGWNDYLLLHHFDPSVAIDDATAL